MELGEATFIGDDFSSSDFSSVVCSIVSWLACGNLYAILIAMVLGQYRKVHLGNSQTETASSILPSCHKLFGQYNAHPFPQFCYASKCPLLGYHFLDLEPHNEQYIVSFPALEICCQ